MNTPELYAPSVYSLALEFYHTYSRDRLQVRVAHLHQCQMLMATQPLPAVQAAALALVWKEQGQIQLIH